MRLRPSSSALPSMFQHRPSSASRSRLPQWALRSREWSAAAPAPTSSPPRSPVLASPSLSPLSSPRALERSPQPHPRWLSWMQIQIHLPGHRSLYLRSLPFANARRRVHEHEHGGGDRRPPPGPSRCTRTDGPRSTPYSDTPSRSTWPSDIFGTWRIHGGKTPIVRRALRNHIISTINHRDIE